MRSIKNDCCGCSTETYPCIGNACKLRNVLHFYCDDCGEETELYLFDGKELCIDCVSKRLVKVGE